MELVLRWILLLGLWCSPTLGHKTFLVHMAKSMMPESYNGDHQAWYMSIMKSAVQSTEILYTYDTVLHGFAARLTDEEAELLRQRPEALSVYEEAVYQLHTTRTPEFLGLDGNNGLWPESDYATDVIVGVLDTGASPESKSYVDAGLGPVPSKWRGECQTGKNFDASSCNRKLIGAQFFSKGYEAVMGPIDETKESKSPKDDDGHGTHTSTTAAGAYVEHASLFGYAEGTARGMATRARIAAYKVCWAGGCFSSDIIAAMDRAVADGVHILSLSLGGGSIDYDRDSIAVGAFGAMEHGVFVSCSAGNSGSDTYSVSNVAPWIATIGAGTLDRDFPAYVALGNGQNFSGVSLYSGKPLSQSPLPFIYAANASNTTNGNLCLDGTLVEEKVAGKIVLCDRGVTARVAKGAVVKKAGGVGMVLANTASNGEELVADAHLLPATGVGEKSGEEIKSYLLSDKNPTANIVFLGTKVNIRPSPVVAAFSSRGPNPLTSAILKPDMIAPGVNILAGWSDTIGPTGLPSDTRRVEYNIISGTSMSCPHISGLAALLKAAHPEWSPATIKSALMTTAYKVDNTGEMLRDVATGRPATYFDFGAGHVDPQKALDPRLVYDTTPTDYLDFLCALNYSSTRISAIAKRTYACGSGNSVGNLNYPSFAVPFETATSTESSTPKVLTYSRTVTNVGQPATYRASVIGGDPVKITVEPESLTFGEKGQKKSFTVTFTAGSLPSGSMKFATLELSDGTRTVASPIAMTWT
ncbi:hypothetical protein AMTRI_Chr12g235490 [Amborella trichopoda]